MGGKRTVSSGISAPDEESQERVPEPRQLISTAILLGTLITRSVGIGDRLTVALRRSLAVCTRNYDR